MHASRDAMPVGRFGPWASALRGADGGGPWLVLRAAPLLHGCASSATDIWVRETRESLDEGGRSGKLRSCRATPRSGLVNRLSGE